MVHLGILLIAGGLAGALFRDYTHGRPERKQSGLPAPSPALKTDAASDEQAKAYLDIGGGRVFDDIGELQHYQKTSWYALAFSASGVWFYPPAALVSAPLLGYNAYNLVKTIRQSDKAERTSPMTIFEVIAIGGTMLTGRPATASILMLLSFGTRKLLLQAGNITNNIGFSKPINPRNSRIWVLRDGVEIESSLRDLLPTDVIILHRGDTVIVEGRVLEGEAVMRQFSLRKQMKLVPKRAGDRVFPFTQIEEGCLHISTQ